jgi:hypothetical protein
MFVKKTVETASIEALTPREKTLANGIRAWANGIRAYTKKTRLRGLKSRQLKLCYLLQSAEADIVCVDANSIRTSYFNN